MSRNRLGKFLIDPKKSIKVKNTPKVASNTSLTEAQAEEFQTNLLDLCQEIDRDSAHGFVSGFEQFRETTVNAWNTYYQALAAAPAGAWPGRPARPAWLDAIHYNNVMRQIDADDAAAQAAGGGFAANVNYEVDETDMVTPDMTPAEFQSVFWQILETFAHSGFTGVGDYHQTLKFTYQGLPDDTHNDHILEMSAVVTKLPNNCTPRNVGVYYAETIARTAKERNIFFDWGIRHRVPSTLNHLGFATWEYIKDPSLINDSMRTEMYKVSLASIRDKDTFAYHDPSAPYTGDTTDVEFAAHLAKLNIEEDARRQERLRLARTPSRPGTSYSFRPRRSDAGSEDA